MVRKARERGFVLVAALAIAILYFMLMELILMDSSRALAEAQRFRSRTVAAALAENGAELAAQQIADHGGANVTTTDSMGSVNGRIRWLDDQHFELSGDGTTKGLVPQTAHVTIQGTINPATKSVQIDYTIHTQ